jgi:hypothetical protein
MCGTNPITQERNVLPPPPFTPNKIRALLKIEILDLAKKKVSGEVKWG